MKKLILLAATTVLFVSCNDDDCNCTQARYERVAEYTPNGEIFAATDWNKTGGDENYNSEDCNQDGTIASSGETDVTIEPNGNTSQKEFEYRVTCQ